MARVVSPVGGGSSTVTLVVADATGSLTAAQCTNSVISNYGQSEANTQELPTAAAGLAFVAMAITTGMGAFNFHAKSSDKIYLNGTAGSDHGTIGLATPASGDTASFVCLQTGASSYDWFVTTFIGTWAVV